jgi:hypothetical protein
MYEKYSKEDKKLFCSKVEKVLLLPAHCYRLLEQLKVLVPEAVVKGLEDILKERPDFLTKRSERMITEIKS